MKVQYNDENDNLWCVGCKNRIHLGEKYIILEEEIYDGEIVKKEFHPECLPETE
ncbi:MAG: hypothetical protein ACTSXT_08090 [Candidatus Helarchaeota archaeon]